MSKGPQEPRDIALAEELVFRPRGLVLEPFAKEEIVRHKTPDRRVKLAGRLVAYSEIKSPRDDWLDEQLDQAPAGAIVGGARQDPTFNRIARHIQRAAQQFDAVNPTRAVPNVLVFVNHDGTSGPADLHETLTGVFRARTGERFTTMRHISDGLIGNAKQRIDAFLWIDPTRRRLTGCILNEGATPQHGLLVCQLLGLDPAKIEH
jgi:hypothetical protein